MLIQKIAMLLAVAYSNKFFFFNKLVFEAGNVVYFSCSHKTYFYLICLSIVFDFVSSFDGWS